MQVEIWSDVICPWCYIGKRRFEAALAQFPRRETVKVIWRSFELDPHAPRERKGTLEEMLAQKYGVSLAQAAAMNSRVTTIAREVGLEYRLTEAKPGNTFDAHRLLHLATAHDLGARATERLMHAYFCEGLPVSDHNALTRLAPEFGVDQTEALALLQGDSYAEAVRADEARAAQLGITSVPCFVFDGKFGIAGAQPVEEFVGALQQASIQG